VYDFYIRYSLINIRYFQIEKALTNAQFVRAFLGEILRGRFFSKKNKKNIIFFKSQAANAAAFSFNVRFDDSNIAERSSPLQINPH
jgi:hypothetical protein